jgi:hypothetical protein
MAPYTILKAEIIAAILYDPTSLNGHIPAID